MYDVEHAGQLHRKDATKWTLNRGSNYHITVSGLSEAKIRELRKLLVEAYTQGRQIEEEEWEPLLSPSNFQFHELQEWFDRALPVYRDRLQQELDTAETEKEEFQAKEAAVHSLHVWPSDTLDMKMVLDAEEMSDRFIWRVLKSTFLTSANGRRQYLRRLDDDLHSESSLFTAWRFDADDSHCPACREAAGLYPLHEPPKLPLHVGGCSPYVFAEYDADDL